MRKYLLTSGRGTDRIEEYVVDLFRLYLKVYPGDIPGASGLGFDFNLGDTRKADIPYEVSTRVNQLVRVIQDRFIGGVTISLDSVDIIDETLAKIVVTVNRDVTEEISFNLYNE